MCRGLGAVGTLALSEPRTVRQYDQRGVCEGGVDLRQAPNHAVHGRGGPRPFAARAVIFAHMVEDLSSWLELLPAYERKDQEQYNRG